MTHRSWACASIAACSTSFVAAALPYLQLIAVCISIGAGIKSWLESRKK